MQAQLDQLRADIRAFRGSSGVESVVVLWTANTERYSAVRQPRPQGLGFRFRVQCNLCGSQSHAFCASRHKVLRALRAHEAGRLGGMLRSL